MIHFYKSADTYDAGAFDSQFGPSPRQSNIYLLSPAVQASTTTHRVRCTNRGEGASTRYSKNVYVSRTDIVNVSVAGKCMRIYT